MTNEKFEQLFDTAIRHFIATMEDMEPHKIESRHIQAFKAHNLYFEPLRAALKATLRGS